MLSWITSAFLSFPLVGFRSLVDLHHQMSEPSDRSAHKTFIRAQINLELPNLVKKHSTKQSFASEMLGSPFSAQCFDYDGAQQGYSPLQGFEEECIDDLWSGYNLYHHDGPSEKGTPLVSGEQQCFQDLAAMDDMQLDTISAAMQSLDKPLALETEIEQPLLPEICELLGSKEKTSPVTFSSLELLNNYRSSHGLLSGEKLNEPIDGVTYPTGGGDELSTEEVIRIAVAHFVQMSTHKESDPRHRVGFSFLGLTNEEIKNVDLASLLLAAAEKVSNQQYDRASNLLQECRRLSSDTGNPVQRVVFYFADALQERIDRETGGLSWKVPKDRGMTAQEAIKATLSAHPLQLALHKKMLLRQIMEFTSMQTILDNVATARKIHLIDLSIKHGLQWVILLQALSTRSTCPIDRLKISAVGLSEEAITATGNRLVSFAEALGLPSSFKAVIVSDIKDLSEDMFELEEGEAIGVYSAMVMSSMIASPDILENVMRVIRKLKPCIMTVADVEAELNSPSFINRFTEALFYSSAFFDYLASFMDRDDKIRIAVEGSLLSQGIRSIIATEGSERVVRHVGISVWRSFFARYGLVETEMNEWSYYQASLLGKQFANGHFLTLDKNGKALTMGWKGTPLLFLSAWKFQ
ncbi:DELLA protein RGL1-like [Phoenix dactylifera]|uniref:DELLA protein RGL1-like n=1 Tax=Phoenix dactylifera TaxID=42345 RepID=A0A8B7D575_PHODC|nr:DELLA protein RGL1-like [Phoenix dactylifera]